MVRAFNLRWAGSPRYVEICRSTREVVRSLQRALDEGLRVTVRSGNHCYEDFAVGNDGGVILDLSSMTKVFRDRVTGWYCVEAGATLWEVYTRLYREHGVTIPGGSCWSVGAGGHVIGGGSGTLSRRDGITVDYLHAVELVHVTRDRRAEVIIVRRDSPDPAERELLWAHLGGGGGNFGIVTRFWFKDPPAAPREAHSLMLDWHWDGLERADFARLVRAFDGFLAANSDPGSPYADLDATLRLRHKSAGRIGLRAHYFGARPELLTAFADTILAALPGRVRPPEGHRLPWLLAAQAASAAGPPQRAKHKSTYMNKPFPDGQIDVLWDFLTASSHSNPHAVVTINAHGGRVNAIDPAATAVAQRSAIMLIHYQSYWSDPAEDEPNLLWLRDLYTAMYGPRGPMPDGTHDGCFVNYCDVDLTDWQTLYYKENYPRLRQVKKRLDPLDIFHHRQSIELP